MKKHCRNKMWSLAWIWLVVMFCGMVQAAAPDWQVVNYPLYTAVLARVQINGVPIRSEGSLLAAFYGDELCGVSEICGAKPGDYIDGEYYFSLMFGSETANETSISFKLWNSADDQIYEIDKTLDFDTNYPTKPEIYGGFIGANFAPVVMNAIKEPVPHTLKVSGGKINGTSATSAQFRPGEIVTIAATLPTNQGLKIWTSDTDVEFIGSVLGATTTIRMPAHDVTITASFIAKSSMQAVSVRSTTNTGDDTAQEPSSTTAVADKGKFTFTRTSSSGALTVYFDIRGTAENGVDYKTIPSSVTFASGKTSVECNIEPLFDGDEEGDETVQVVLVPATPTQTYRGGTYTDATVTIEDSELIVDPTVKYTLSPAAAVTAGAKWKIDEGSWNDSGATVTTSVGNHTISFKAVSGYATPASQTITLASGENKVGTVTYVPGLPTLTIVNGKINMNGSMVSSAQIAPGEEVTITATVPSATQALKIWTPDSDVEFIGSVLGATTTIRMPAHDVTVTASFIAKSSMQAVAVRSTTNAGDDTAQEPSSTTAAADKCKFTFTRTSSSGSLTVYFDIRGTATNGTDYKSITSSITFASGSTSVSREIEPLYDGVKEGDETVEVVLIPATPTQTYRGGTYTDATVTIKDSTPVIDPTIKYTLSASDGSDINAAGAKWKIDDGAWNDSAVTVTSTVGPHTIYFKDVTGYNTPASQTITLASGENKTGTAVYEKDDGKYTLTVVKGTINGTSATTAKFVEGEIVTIAATVPSSTQALKIWTPDSDVEFIGSVLGATTTIRMPAHDVTITASFSAKSSMQAVAVRSTTNAGDDTAQEPLSATAAADKGKFTFTRTSSSGSLTVYFDIRGTATNGTDYKSIPSSITFASGSTSVTREIEPLFDGVNESDETVQVVLIPATPTQTYRGGAVTDATITIKDTPVTNPTVKYTLSPAAAVTAGAQWKIDNGSWNNSGATVTSTVGTHTISFKTVTGYTAPANQTITLSAGETKIATATYVPDNVVAYHPADCIDQDYIISGLEYLNYIGPVKSAALGGYEYDWDGVDLLSMVRKATRGGDVLQTRGANDIGITRTVSPAAYTPGSTVTVTLTISGADKMTNLFIGERIPEGWTVVGNTANSVADGVLRATWDAPNIPGTYTYTMQAPTANVAASYVIASSAVDTGCYTDELVFIDVADTELLNNYHYHPADCITKDGKISGLEYLKYAGPVKALALANEEYTWDGVDVLSIRRKNATRGGAAVDDVAILRNVDTTTYEAGGQVIVTLTITGADSMVSLFVGETILKGWSVIGNHADNVKNGVLRMTWDAPNIPEKITYTLQAPAEDLSGNCRISSSSADTGCFVNRVLFLDAGETVLTHGSARKPAEWPQDMTLYAPVDGRNFREADNLAVSFSWPAILNADGYRLVVTTYDGTVVFDETVSDVSCTVRGLNRGSFVWNVTAIGDDCIAGTTWQDFRFAVVHAVPVPIIVGAVADGTVIRLAYDMTEPGYTDGVFTYQALFYSLEANTLKPLMREIQVANGEAVIDLGVNASNGYLYIRPVTTPESDFTELYIK